MCYFKQRNFNSVTLEPPWTGPQLLPPRNDFTDILRMIFPLKTLNLHLLGMLSSWKWLLLQKIWIHLSCVMKLGEKSSWLGLSNGMFLSFWFDLRFIFSLLLSSERYLVVIESNFDTLVEGLLLFRSELDTHGDLVELKKKPWHFCSEVTTWNKKKKSLSVCCCISCVDCNFVYLCKLHFPPPSQAFMCPHFS